MWSTQVRFVLLELLFEVIFVLDRKGGILQQEYAAKRWLVGGVGAWSEIQEVERAARSRSWRGQRDKGARLWSEVVQRGRGARVVAS